MLPEHVAVQMRKDLGLIDTQFKKIYMSRHENVRYDLHITSYIIYVTLSINNND